MQNAVGEQHRVNTDVKCLGMAPEHLEGSRNILCSPNLERSKKRTEAAKKAAAANGMKVKEVLWVQGQYDLVVISESSDETKSNAFALSTLKMGNVRGQTLRAFTAAEMEKILEQVA